METPLSAAASPVEGARPAPVARNAKRTGLSHRVPIVQVLYRDQDEYASGPVNSDPRAELRNRLAIFATVVILVAAFCSFLFSLERFPEPQPDEVFFNYPAVRHLEGHGLNWQVSPNAPHGDTIWAYHGPFFPRVQAATLRVMGVSHFAFRLPEYVAGHAAIWLLCGFLLARRHRRAAMVVALIWLGDISMRTLQNGRMDGIAFFFVTLGFVALFKALTNAAAMRDPQSAVRSSWLWSAVASASLGISAGFHPVCVYFVAAGLVAVALFATAESRLRLLGAYMAGLLAPAALVALCWGHNLPAALEQFRWYAGRWTPTENIISTERLQAISRRARWSVGWMGVLAAATCVIGLVLAVARGKRDSTGRLSDNDVLWRLAAIFALTGLVIFGRMPGVTYYYLYFSVWPALAIMVALSSRSLSLWPARVMRAALALLVLAWVPSLALNLAMFRTMAIFHARLNPTYLVEALKQSIPADAEVVGSPVLTVRAREAGLNFTPLPWAGRELPIPSEAWVALTEGDWKRGHRTDERTLEGRHIVYQDNPFPNTAPYMDFPIVILSPVNRGAGAPPGEEPPTERKARTIQVAGGETLR